MKKNNLLIVAITCLSALSANAQYTNLHSFNDTDGAVPYGSLTLSGNTLYGVTVEGGANWISNDGNIFSLQTNGSAYKDLYDFNFSNGRNPYCKLALSGNTLYGLTWMGEANNHGDIFTINANGTSYSDIYNFVDSTGGNPRSSVIMAGGMLYGTTESGGKYDYGCIFSIDTNGSNYKDLFDFNDTDGGYPKGALVLSSGVLYGTTETGGAYDNGNIFSIHTNGSGFTDMLDFNNSNGAYPEGSLILIGNRLYGTTYYGGANYSYGNIFSININGSGFKDLHDFADSDGANPSGDLVLSGNTLYGMTSDGGLNNEGLIFSLDTNGNGYTDLLDFNYTNGASPYGSLTISGNMLYGMTSGGGTYGAGVVFSFDITASVVPLAASVNSTTNVTCNAGSNGSISANASGGTSPYTYNWSPVAGTAATLSNLSAGSYTVTVTDIKGNSATASITLTQPNAFIDSVVSITNPLCNGELAANVLVGTQGGTPPYTYLWSPNTSNGPSVNNIPAGTYTVNITDNKGCQQQLGISVTEPAVLRAGIKSKDCQDAEDGTATIKVAGGTAPYTYNWAPGGGTKATMSGLSTGTYTITVTDSHNCFDTVSVTFNCKGNTTGDNQISNNTLINVFPNPTANMVNITGIDKGMTVEMYDNLGRNMSTLVADNEAMQLNLFNQPNGIYLVRILARDGTLISQKKVIKTN